MGLLTFDYLIDPDQIEKDSFRHIRKNTDLSPFAEFEQQIVMRMIHTCGCFQISEHVRISSEAVQQGLNAITQSSSILCDVEMVRKGITQRFLYSEPLCFINDESTASRASLNSVTRSMAAIDQWQEHIENSIVLIGNAPTALFKLLENISKGWPKPALVVGMPVGFVGAAESKDALWEHHKELGLECISLLGHMGGSALTVSAMNALLRIHSGIVF